LLTAKLNGHTLPGLGRLPLASQREVKLNLGTVVLAVWSSALAPDALAERDFLSGFTDPAAAARGHAGGHLLQLEVPLGRAMAADDGTVGKFFLPRQWLSEMRVTAAYDVSAGGQVVAGYHAMAPMAPRMRRVPMDQLSSMAADQYFLAVGQLSPAARGLLGDDGRLREQLHELVAFALSPWEAGRGPGGDAAWLDSHVPEVLLDPQIGQLLDVIGGQIAYATGQDRPMLESIIGDLVLGASLVPVRRIVIGGREVRLTMDMLPPAQLVL
jgi:hypothetical protein